MILLPVPSYILIGSPAWIFCFLLIHWCGYFWYFHYFLIKLIIAGLFPCITVIWLLQAYRYSCSYIQNQLTIPFVYTDSCFNLPHSVTEGRKIPGFRGCQGHKISLAISNSSNNLAILSCKNSFISSLSKCVIERIKSYNNRVEKICRCLYISSWCTCCITFRYGYLTICTITLWIIDCRNPLTNNCFQLCGM